MQRLSRHTANLICANVGRTTNNAWTAVHIRCDVGGDSSAVASIDGGRTGLEPQIAAICGRGSRINRLHEQRVVLSIRVCVSYGASAFATDAVDAIFDDAVADGRVSILIEDRCAVLRAVLPKNYVRQGWAANTVIADSEVVDRTTII